MSPLCATESLKERPFFKSVVIERNKGRVIKITQNINKSCISIFRVLPKAFSALLVWWGTMKQACFIKPYQKHSSYLSLTINAHSINSKRCCFNRHFSFVNHYINFFQGYFSNYDECFWYFSLDFISGGSECKLFSNYKRIQVFFISPKYYFTKDVPTNNNYIPHRIKWNVVAFKHDLLPWTSYGPGLVWFFALKHN